MKRIYNQFPYMANLGMQITTPESDENAQMEANRPINAPYHMSWPRSGWLSQSELNNIRHWDDIANSKAKRKNKTK